MIILLFSSCKLSVLVTRNASLHAKVLVFNQRRLLLAAELTRLIETVCKHFGIMVLDFRAIQKAELAAVLWIRRNRAALIILESKIAEDPRRLQQSLILLFMNLALLFLLRPVLIDPTS